MLTDAELEMLREEAAAQLPSTNAKKIIVLIQQFRQTRKVAGFHFNAVLKANSLLSECFKKDLLWRHNEVWQKTQDAVHMSMSYPIVTEENPPS